MTGQIKIYDEPESPNDGARNAKCEGVCKISADPESPNEGGR